MPAYIERKSGCDGCPCAPFHAPAPKMSPRAYLVLHLGCSRALVQLLLQQGQLIHVVVPQRIDAVLLLSFGLALNLLRIGVHRAEK